MLKEKELKFKSRNYAMIDNVQVMEFHMGTCAGLWASKNTMLSIIAITNDEKGNGHFDIVMKHFEKMAAEKEQNLFVKEIWNNDLKKHLIHKKCFVEVSALKVKKKWQNCNK